jgi:hypothetical protein
MSHHAQSLFLIFWLNVLPCNFAHKYISCLWWLHHPDSGVGHMFYDCLHFFSKWLFGCPFSVLETEPRALCMLRKHLFTFHHTVSFSWDIEAYKIQVHVPKESADHAGCGIPSMADSILWSPGDPEAESNALLSLVRAAPGWFDHCLVW